MEYHNLHASFGVPSLSDRRLYLNLCMMYKIIHNLIYFPVGVFVPRVTTVSRSSANHCMFSRLLIPMHTTIPLYLACAPFGTLYLPL